MKSIAIFPVTFARVEDLGGDYVPMNLTEFFWPKPLGEETRKRAEEASQTWALQVWVGHR